MSADKKKHILIVEDNLIAAKAAKRLLESLDCQVDLAASGEEAIKMVLENLYDAISLDIGLPVKNGVEVCEAIRKHEAENHLSLVPIVAVTGNNSSEEVEEYLTVGMQAVLDKPFTKEKAQYLLSFCK